MPQNHLERAYARHLTNVKERPINAPPEKVSTRRSLAASPFTPVTSFGVQQRPDSIEHQLNQASGSQALDQADKGPKAMKTNKTKVKPVKIGFNDQQAEKILQKQTQSDEKMDAETLKRSDQQGISSTITMGRKPRSAYQPASGFQDPLPNVSEKDLKILNAPSSSDTMICSSKERYQNAAYTTENESRKTNMINHGFAAHASNHEPDSSQMAIDLSCDSVPIPSDLRAKSNLSKDRMQETLKNALETPIVMTNRNPSDRRMQEACSNTLSHRAFESSPTAPPTAHPRSFGSTGQNAMKADRHPSEVGGQDSPRVSANMALQNTLFGVDEVGANLPRVSAYMALQNTLFGYNETEADRGDEPRPRHHLFQEADPIARHTEQWYRGKSGRQYRSDATRPIDPQLAASFDSMAREHAKIKGSSPSTTSVLQCLAGKRKRDAFQKFRGFDLSSPSYQKVPTSIEATKKNVSRQEPIQNTMIGENHDQVTHNSSVKEKEIHSQINPHLTVGLSTMPSTRSQKASAKKNDILPRNELDFLATVVIAHGTPKEETKNVEKVSGKDGGLPKVKQGLMTEGRGVHVANASVSRSMSADNKMTTKMNATFLQSEAHTTHTHVIADREAAQTEDCTADEIKPTPSSLRILITSSMGTQPMTPPLQRMTNTAQNALSLYQVSEVEAKSEVSNVEYIQPQVLQTANYAQGNASLRMSDESMPQDEVDVEDEITTTPALQPGYSKAPPIVPRTSDDTRTFGRGMGEVDEITPAPQGGLSSQKRFIASRQRSKKAPPPQNGPSKGPQANQAAPPVAQVDVDEITPAPRPNEIERSPATSSSEMKVDTSGAEDPKARGHTGASSGENNAGQAGGNRQPLPYRFACEFCPSTFNRNFNLNKHMRSVHQNIRNFKCPMCKERFQQKSHRKSHLMAVHQKLRPFACHLCKKKFSWLGVLRKHLQSIHKVKIQTKNRSKRTPADEKSPAKDKPTGDETPMADQNTPADQKAPAHDNGSVGDKSSTDDETVADNSSPSN